jgi:hypothetical protein
MVPSHRNPPYSTCLRQALQTCQDASYQRDMEHVTDLDRHLLISEIEFNHVPIHAIIYPITTHPRHGHGKPLAAASPRAPGCCPRLFPITIRPCHHRHCDSLVVVACHVEPPAELPPRATRRRPRPTSIPSYWAS